MTTQAALKIPAAGFQMVQEPCGECLHAVREFTKGLAHAGEQSDCYGCGNRITVVRTERADAGFGDRLGIARFNEQPMKPVLVGLVFEKATYREPGARQWMAAHELQGLDKARPIGHEWLAFEKVSAHGSDACVLVRLADGVLGRVGQEPLSA